MKLDDLSIQNINYDFISLYTSYSLDIFEISHHDFKVFSKGYVGENENHCFFEFHISFIISYTMLENVGMYLKDILFAIFLILIDIEHDFSSMPL